MSDSKHSRPGKLASLTDLLAEHTQLADQEKREIEAKLRAKDEQEKKQKEAEEERQKQLLQARLEEEQRRAQQRFQKRDAPQASAVEPEEESPAAKAAAAAAAAAAPMTPPKPSAARVFIAVAATLVITAGLAVGAFFLFLNDRSPQADVLRSHASAAITESTMQAEALIAVHAANGEDARKAAIIEGLRAELAASKADTVRLTGEKSVAEEAALAAQAEAERQAQLAAEAAEAAPTNGRRTGGRRKPDRSGEIRVKPVFDPRRIVH